MCVAFLVFLIGGSIGLVMLAKHLVATKAVAVPLEREEYLRFRKNIRWFIGPAVALAIFGPFLILPMLQGQERVPVHLLPFLAVGVALLFGIMSFLYVCPKCGKLLSWPVKGSYDALYHLSVGACSKCGFKFRSEDADNR